MNDNTTTHSCQINVLVQQSIIYCCLFIPCVYLLIKEKNIYVKFLLNKTNDLKHILDMRIISDQI